ncbi:MAG: PAS domain S-box protein, partial [Anaerolineae bacterium]|nr:PAS domain S-box protein [Anaerolineae bacterium]
MAMNHADQDHTILIIDDDASTLKALVSYLQGLGFKPLAARSGERGLDVARRSQPDLILLDVMMPGLDGFETCRRLKAEPTLKDIPVIFLTALSNAADKIKGFEAGAVDYITKPIQNQEVLARINIHLRLHELTERLAQEVQGQIQELNTEIAERRQIEKALRESEARYRAVVNSQVDLVSRYLPDTTLTFVNDAYCEFFGKTREELIGHSYLFMIAPEFRELVRQEAENLAKDPRPLVGEYLNYRHDGKECWIQWVVHCISDENGQVVELQAVGRDITERHRAEEALRESEERLRQIASSLREVIWLRDVQTRQVLYVNPAFEELTGRTCESFYENPDIVIDAIHPDDKEGVIKALDQRFEGVPFDKEHRIIHLDGSVRWVSSRSFPVQNEAGEVYRWAAIMEDITERKRAEAALRESEERYRLLAEAAHDMIFILNREGNVTYVNSFAAQQLGRLPEEIIGRPQAEYFASGDAERQQLGLRQVFEAGQPLYIESSTQFPTRKMWLGTWLVPIKDEASQAKSILGISRDITDRKQAEAQLERNLRETRLRFEVSQALAGTETEDEVLDVLIQYAGLYSQVFVAIMTFDCRGGERTAIVRRQDTFESGLTATAPIGGRLPPSIYTISRHHSAAKPFVSEDVFADARVDPATREIFRQTGAGSLTFVPLMAENEWMGFIGAMAKHTSYFDEEKLHLYQTLAEQGAMALRAARLRETIRESAERIRAVFEGVVDGVVVTNLQGEILDCNEAAVLLLGRDSREELLGHNSIEMIVEDERPQVLEEVREALEIGHVGGITGRKLLRKDGSVYDGEISTAFLRDAEGNPAGFVVGVRDITERKQAEEALRESEDRFRIFADEVSFEGIIIHDEGKILDVNRQFSQMHGYERSELIGMTDSLAKTIAPEYREIVLKHIQEGYKKPYGAVALKKDGSTFPIEIRAKIIPFHGKMVRATAVRDITERVRAEEEIRKLNAELEQRVARRTRQIETVVEVSQQLTGILDLPTLLR